VYEINGTQITQKTWIFTPARLRQQAGIFFVDLRASFVELRETIFSGKKDLTAKTLCREDRKEIVNRQSRIVNSIINLKSQNHKYTKSFPLAQLSGYENL